MKKNYIIGTFIGLILVILFSVVLFSADKKEENAQKSLMFKVGQMAWTYNMNEHEWNKYNEEKDDINSKDTITLQYEEIEGNGGYTTYHLLTGNRQVPKEDVWVGEGSQEFLVGKKLYSYYPKNFEFYEIIFNGVKFVPNKLSQKDISKIIKGYNIIKVSDLKKKEMDINFSRFNNKFIVLNDIGDDFYKYYIVPNDSKKMQIGDFSNQFKVKDNVDIRIQRLEGCSKAYPCYEIKIK